MPLEQIVVQLFTMAISWLVAIGEFTIQYNTKTTNNKLTSIVVQMHIKTRVLERRTIYLAVVFLFPKTLLFKWRKSYLSQEAAVRESMVCSRPLTVCLGEPCEHLLIVSLAWQQYEMIELWPCASVLLCRWWIEITCTLFCIKISTFMQGFFNSGETPLKIGAWLLSHCQ